MHIEYKKVSLNFINLSFYVSNKVLIIKYNSGSKEK